MIAVFVPLFSLLVQLTRVKTELSFVAEDPWNGNRPSTFTLDDCGFTLRGAKYVPGKAGESPWRVGLHRAFRSEADGVVRFLPESQIELWSILESSPDGRGRYAGCWGVFMLAALPGQQHIPNLQ
jgi:hypothetical protein